MAKLTLDISMSLDGFIAGPNQTRDQPLGEGGEGLHEWAVVLESWRERHGLSGGETNPDSEVVDEALRKTGATVMGRRMFSGGEGAWADDTNADGWWGDDPPFHHQVFILTHHPREKVTKQGGTTFTFAPTESKPRSSRPRRPRATRTSRSAAARTSRSSTSRRACSTSCSSTSFPCSSATAFACSTATSAPGRSSSSARE
jgi:dihydrofolate reductase